MKLICKYSEKKETKNGDIFLQIDVKSLHL